VFYRACRVMARAFKLVVIATVGGCVSPEQAAQQIARDNGLQPVLLQGTNFRHHAFAAVRGSSDQLVVFIDGDGLPWVGGGRRIATDPSPRRPLALRLAAATAVSVLYLARPCYLEKLRSPQCPAALWTSQRYSAAVVASMTAAANVFAAEHHFDHVLLVGYSGGGTLAALMARDLPGVVGLVTIAGNLDPDTWAQLHGYLPLQGSLNPALLPPLPKSLPQWYLVGQRDTNVPAGATARYFERVSPERIWSYPRFDHVCCWVDDWPATFARISEELQQLSSDPTRCTPTPTPDGRCGEIGRGSAGGY
jgi:hypothetical protein